MYIEPPFNENGLEHCASAELLHTLPQGGMEPYLGRQYTWTELRQAHNGENDSEKLHFVRAFEVPPLIGAMIHIENETEIADAIKGLFKWKLPGMDWEIKDNWRGPFLKYFVIHGSIPAPADLLTHEPMALEISGRITEVDRLKFDSPAGWEWQRRRQEQAKEIILKNHGDFERLEFEDLYPPFSGKIVIRINSATYANIMFPGVGVPVYM